MVDIRFSILKAGFGETCYTVTLGATFDYFESDLFERCERRAFLPFLSFRSVNTLGSIDDRYDVLLWNFYILSEWLLLA